jgi:phosphohistidine phosphatase
MEPEQFELYLIRHGVAAERGDQFPDDAKRPLTARGIQRLKRAGKALEALEVSFDVILSSPLVRTRQSAIVDDLAKQSHRRKKIAIVGHEPGIGELAARLMGLRKPIEFKKGAICRIDVAALPPTGNGQLKWFLTPRILRKIG